MRSLSDLSLAKEGWSKDKPGTILGQPAICYSYKYTAKNISSKVLAAESWYAKEIPICKAVAEFFAISRGTPTVELLPLQTTFYEEHKHVYTSVDIMHTSEIKPFNPPPHFWDLPPSYKKATGPFGVWSDSGDDSGAFAREMLDGATSSGKHR
jgi:hypothetical protein